MTAWVIPVALVLCGVLVAVVCILIVGRRKVSPPVDDAEPEVGLRAPRTGFWATALWAMRMTACAVGLVAALLAFKSQFVDRSRSLTELLTANVCVGVAMACLFVERWLARVAARRQQE